jgi:hypothetical protein
MRGYVTPRPAWNIDGPLPLGTIAGLEVVLPSAQVSPLAMESQWLQEP